MKRALPLILFIFAAGSLYAQLPVGKFFGDVRFPQDSAGVSWYAWFTFAADNTYELTVEFEMEKPSFSLPGGQLEDQGGFLVYTEKGSCRIERVEGVPFFKTAQGSLLDGSVVLHHARRIVFCKGGIPLFVSGYPGNAANALPGITEASASSFLTQGKTVYGPDNLDIDNGKQSCLPWVENAGDHGVGESVSLSFTGFIPIQGFLFSNGFVSAEKPALYGQNSRIRKLRIDNGRGDVREITLQDHPDLQYIELYPGRKGAGDDPVTETYRFTVLEVYEGSKWSDTCLNLIIPVAELSEGLR